MLCPYNLYTLFWSKKKLINMTASNIPKVLKNIHSLKSWGGGGLTPDAGSFLELDLLIHHILSSIIKLLEFIFLLILAFQVFKSTSGASKRSGGAGYNSHSESNVVNAIGSRVFGTNQAAVNQTNKPPTIPQQTPFFKSAGTELVCVMVYKLINVVFHIFSMFP